MFNITDFLIPNVRYDQMALKQAYYDACAASDGNGDYFGTRFRESVNALANVGAITMPMVKDRHGEKTDFFSAVIAMYHRDDERFRAIRGELVLEYYDDIVQVEIDQAVMA